MIDNRLVPIFYHGDLRQAEERVDLMSNAQAVTGKDFDEKVLKSDIPVLVDFWASWCNPCKMIAPHVDALAAEFEGKALVMKVNVDEEPEISTKYGIRSIPTLLFFKGGSVAQEVVGVQPKAVLADHLQKLI